MRLIKDPLKAIEELKLQVLKDQKFYNNTSRVKRTLTRLIQKVKENNLYAKMQLKQYYKILKAQKDKEVKTRCTNLLILPHMIEKKISLYNGKQYKLIKLKDEMLGRYLGEFILTRTKGAHSARGQSGDKIKR